MSVFRRGLGESTLRLRMVSAATLGLCSVALINTPVAFADELKILDLLGKTRSAVEMTDGTMASVSVTLTSNGSLGGIALSLIDTKTNSTIQSATTNANGIATFKNVPTGTFKVGMSKGATATIANIAIMNDMSQSSEELGEGEKRSTARAMYIGGASAVVGGVGIALGSSSNSSGNGSLTTSSAIGAGDGSFTVGGSDAGSFAGGNGGSETVAGFEAPNAGPPSAGPTITPITPPSNNTGDPNNTGGGNNPDPNPPAPNPVDPPPLSGS